MYYKQYEGESRNFVYSKWVLNILPTSIISNAEEFISSINRSNSKSRSYGLRTIIAMDSSDMFVSFVVDDFPIHENKMISYRVRSYTLVNEESELNNIQSFAISGSIIDHFFSPYKKTLGSFDYKSRIVDVRLENHKSGEIEFNIDNHNVIALFHTVISKIQLKNINSLPNMKSEMYITSSTTLTFDQFEKMLSIITDFFKLIYYTREISFDQIRLFSNSKVGKSNVGYYNAKSFSEVVVDMSRMPKIDYYDFENVENELSGVLNILNSEDINLNFIARNQLDRNYYSSMRYIETIASFEKNFKAYFLDYKIDQKYINAMKEIQLKIDELTLGKDKKQCAPYVSLRNQINEYNPLDKRLSYIKKNDDFIQTIEKLFGDDLEKDKDLIKRLNAIRNKIAHGETSIDFGADDFLRFKFIIVCVYFLVLKRANLSNQSISKLLHKLYFKI